MVDTGFPRAEASFPPPAGIPPAGGWCRAAWTACCGRNQAPDFSGGGGLVSDGRRFLSFCQMLLTGGSSTDSHLSRALCG